MSDKGESFISVLSCVNMIFHFIVLGKFVFQWFRMSINLRWCQDVLENQENLKISLNNSELWWWGLSVVEVSGWSPVNRVRERISCMISLVVTQTYQWTQLREHWQLILILIIQCEDQHCSGFLEANVCFGFSLLETLRVITGLLCVPEVWFTVARPE